MAGSLGEFEQIVLLAVVRLREEAYGVTIRRAIADRLGRDVAAGAVYTTLGRLESRGFVTSRLGETAPERTGKRRKYYLVEPEGAAALYQSYTALKTMMRGVLPELQILADRAQGSE